MIGNLLWWKVFSSESPENTAFIKACRPAGGMKNLWKLLVSQRQKIAMEPVVSGQLGMKSSRQQIALAGGNDTSVRKPGQHATSAPTLSMSGARIKTA